MDIVLYFSSTPPPAVCFDRIFFSVIFSLLIKIQLNDGDIKAIFYGRTFYFHFPATRSCVLKQKEIRHLATREAKKKAQICFLLVLSLFCRSEEKNLNLRRDRIGHGNKLRYFLEKYLQGIYTHLCAASTALRMFSTWPKQDAARREPNLIEIF